MGYRVLIDHIVIWLDAQDDRTVAGVAAAIESLEREGPTLGRPLVDRIHGSRVHNLKELRPVSPPGRRVRILFAFDPDRRAVLLVAGDKADGTSRRKWGGWYRRNIPIAERRYRCHIERMGGADGYP